jgi:hypothetical protein
LPQEIREEPVRVVATLGRYALGVLGEQVGVVVEVRPFDVHGVPHVDVTLTYPDRSVEIARLGSESVPDRLEAGEQVLVSKVMNVVVAIRRPTA